MRQTRTIGVLAGALKKAALRRIAAGRGHGKAYEGGEVGSKRSRLLPSCRSVGSGLGVARRRAVWLSTTGRHAKKMRGEKLREAPVEKNVKVLPSIGSDFSRA